MGRHSFTLLLSMFPAAHQQCRTYNLSHLTSLRTWAETMSFSAHARHLILQPRHLHGVSKAVLPSMRSLPAAAYNGPCMQQQLQRHLQRHLQRQYNSTLRLSGIHSDFQAVLQRSQQLAVTTWNASNAYIYRGAKDLWLALQQCYYSRPYSWPAWAFTPLSVKLPWGVSRSLQIPWSWLPSREWFLRPGFDARVAILNALYFVGGNLHRCLPLFLGQVLRQDAYLAHCFLDAGPPQDAIKLLHAHQAVQPRTWMEEIAFTVASLVRLAQLSIVFGPLLLTAPLALLYDIGRATWLTWLRYTLQNCGPAFIKWGQWAATRADLFPPDMCAELAKLQTGAPSHPYKLTEEAIFNSFGCAVHDLFDTFDREPIASGSIGQIHRAVLSQRGEQYTGVKSGRTVAVKVRHPGVTLAIERDFSLMMWAAQLAAKTPGLTHLRLEDSLRQFAAPLREQVDFTLEALHLWQFSYNFRRSPYVHFPFPIYPLVSSEVLVETYEDGKLVSEYVKQGPEGVYSPQLAHLGCTAFLQMMLVDNLIHADLHPGNIIVRLHPPRNLVKRTHFEIQRRLTGKTPGQLLEPHFVLLDVGMANWLSPTDQENMMGLFHGLLNLDGAEIGKYTLAFAGNNQSCTDVNGFMRDLSQYFGELKAASSWEDTRYANGAEAMSAALEFVRRHKVNLPGNVCAVLMTTLVLEGWSSQLDPTHPVLEQVEATLKAYSGSYASQLQSWWQSVRANGLPKYDSTVAQGTRLQWPEDVSGLDDMAERAAWRWQHPRLMAA